MPEQDQPFGQSVPQARRVHENAHRNGSTEMGPRIRRALVTGTAALPPRMRMASRCGGLSYMSVEASVQSASATSSISASSTEPCAGTGADGMSRRKAVRMPIATATTAAPIQNAPWKVCSAALPAT